MEKSEVESILKLIDEFIDSLKKELISVEVPSSKIWDKIKNWWFNLTKKKGPNDPQNPYLWKNKFGALGHPEENNNTTNLAIESKKVSLSEYRFIRELYEDLIESMNLLSEEAVNDSENIKKLKIFKIIDSWGNKFKKAVIEKFAKNVQKPEIKATSEPGGSRIDVEAEPKLGTTRINVKASPSFGTRVDTGVRPREELKSMEEIPVKKPSIVEPVKEKEKEKEKEEEEEKPDSVRAGTEAETEKKVKKDEPRLPPGRPSDVLIQWHKNKFIIRKSIKDEKGKAHTKAIDIDPEELKPITELISMPVDKIKELDHSAENLLKLEIFNIITSHAGSRKATGIKPGERLFRIFSPEDMQELTAEEAYDKKFKEVFSKALDLVSTEYFGKDITTSSDSIYKKIHTEVFKRIDDIFKKREGIVQDEDLFHSFGDTKPEHT